ncbi:hypothetical protein ACFYNW_34030 [Streptomyces virginiae]|uniref:hypothetical protein n=1 Tax=Streptomyces virginiae TaxID=1961 RepID=UPI0036E06A75
MSLHPLTPRAGPRAVAVSAARILPGPGPRLQGIELIRAEAVDPRGHAPERRSFSGLPRPVVRVKLGRRLLTPAAERLFLPLTRQLAFYLGALDVVAQPARE